MKAFADSGAEVEQVSQSVAVPEQHSLVGKRRGMTQAVLPVSVIIPAYGHADYVVASVMSALNQSPAPREIIVVDDSSPDDTAMRLAELIQTGRIRYVHQANAGMAAARNAGAKLAISDYLYFLDDDDLLFPDALSWMVEELDAHPGVGMVYGESELFSGVPPARPDYWSDSQPANRIPFFIFNRLGSPGQVLIRRSAFQEVGAFDGTIWGTDDWDLWLRLLTLYPARYAHRPVVAYRLHPQNASRNVSRMFESSYRVARHHLAKWDHHEQRVLKRYCYRELRMYHAPRLVAMFTDSVRQHKWSLARAAARSFVRSWFADAAASALLKLHLVRNGQWRLPKSESLIPFVMR